METLTIALLAILLGNQIYLERKVAKFGNELKHINKCLEGIKCQNQSGEAESSGQ